MPHHKKVLDRNFHDLAHCITEEVDAKKEDKKRLEKELFDLFKVYEKTMGAAVQDLFMTMHEMSVKFTSAMVQEITRLARFQADLQQEEGQGSYLQSIVEGKSIQEQCTISNDTMKQFYQAASYLYEKKEYEKAIGVFLVLIYLNPKHHLFWLGLGNCAFYTKQYEAALLAYAICSITHPSEYRSQLYSAKCYEALNDIELALNALDLALISLGEEPDIRKQICKEKARFEKKQKGGFQ